MKREPLPAYRIYLTVDPTKPRLVNTEHHDLRPVRGTENLGGENTEKKIIIRVQDKDTGKPK